MTIISYILIALFIEAIINIFKPLWNNEADKITVPEYIAMGLGVLIANFIGANILDGLITVDSVIVTRIFYCMTGIAMGRGPSFIYDLWGSLKSSANSEG